MTRVTICYSHRDRGLRGELDKHLAMLRRTGLIEMCHDRRVECGEGLGRLFDAALESADVILLLVSPDFLASDYCYDVEARRALERRKRRGACVIPVILRPCDWRVTLFGNLPAAPADGRPVTTWRNRDEAFLSVVKIVRGYVPARHPAGLSPGTADMPCGR
jgi:hypothetical protein